MACLDRETYVRSAFCGVVVCFAFFPAAAGPWTQIGDAPLRSDVELLASAGVVDTITTQWPIPWAGLLDRLDSPANLDGQAGYILAAADRVRTQGTNDTRRGVHTDFELDVTGSPAVVRGYDALGRQALESTASLEYVGQTTVVHLNLGARSVSKSDHQVFVPDGSYIAQRLGDTVVYAGYMEHWWGPGWMSALALSTNARAIPQVGISRISTAPFQSPWLSWIGPWQVEFFVGVLDGPREARNTLYDGTRLSVSPLPGLEIAVARTDMMCGTGHSCKPLAAYFNPQNDSVRVNAVDDEATLEMRYTGALHQWHYAAYIQVMNEDTNLVTDSGTSHLYGASFWHPMADGIARLTLEYTDSTPSANMFGGFAKHGYSYNSWQYPDGMRYRGQTLGFSLDADSRLMSIQAAFTAQNSWTYSLTYHSARISDLLNLAGNAVTTSPVNLNIVQGRVSIPLTLSEHALHLDLDARYQDDQPRPDKGAVATVEAALRFGM